MNGICLISPTIGVMNSGPMIGTCCTHPRIGGASIATTAAADAAGSTGSTGSASAVARLFVVSWLTPVSRVRAVPKSRRAAASNAHSAGESTGVVGVVSASGLNSAFATVDIATVTGSPRSGSVAVGAAGCSTTVSVTTTSAGGSVSSSAGAACSSAGDSSAALVDSVVLDVDLDVV